MSAQPPSVVIVDDHAIFRSGVRAELEDLVEIRGDAGSVEEAVRMIATERPELSANVMAGLGALVHRFRRDALGEALSVFALTTIVQRIAREAAERLGTDPDTFGKDLPGRGEVWATVPL